MQNLPGVQFPVYFIRLNYKPASVSLASPTMRKDCVLGREGKGEGSEGGRGRGDEGTSVGEGGEGKRGGSKCGRR